MLRPSESVSFSSRLPSRDEMLEAQEFSLSKHIGDCDVDALAFCSDDNLFVDLDPASYDSFIADESRRFLLHYEGPSLMDSLFLRQTENTSLPATKNETVIGRVNCLRQSTFHPITYTYFSGRNTE